ncbi:MAG: hypothetical protein ACC651_11360 [Candidatus Scalindua sp.]
MANEAIRVALSEEQENLNASLRADEATLSYEELPEDLKHMAKYSLTFKKSVAKDFRIIPKKI